MEILKTLVLDFDRNNYNTTIAAKQGDTKSRYIEVILTKNGLAIDITNHTVKVFVRKPDNTIVFNSTEILDAANGKVKIELTNQMLAVVGLSKCEISIYGADDSILATQTFCVNVESTLRDDNAIESSNEFTALTEAVSTVYQYDNRIENVENNKAEKSYVDQNFNSVNSQLNEKTQQVKNVQHTKRRAIVSFVSDDGDSKDITLLKPLFLQYGIPLTTALITTMLNNTSERLSLQNNNGWEIASHTVNHHDLTTLSESQIDSELKDSKTSLESLGFKVNSLVYPIGGNNEAVRRIGKKYYRNGVAIGHQVNKGAISSFSIYRYALGAYFDQPGAPTTNTLAYYKSAVDKALADNAWVIFMLHPGSVDFDTTQQSYLEQTIQYIQSLGIDIVTVNDGYDIFGNALETGDYMQTSPKGLAVSFSGDLGNLATQLIDKTGLNNASLVTAFPSNCISATTFLNGDNAGFPTGAGTLFTSRLNADDTLSYQIWHDCFKNNTYKRRCSGGVWQPWYSDFGLQLISKTGINNASLVTAFPQYRISATTFLNADSAGFPTSAGTLLTYRLDFQDDLSYQMWMPYNDTKTYKRLCSSGVWQSWISDSGVKVIDKTGLNNTSLVTAFPTGCISTVTFLNGDNAGFPTGAGTLLTSRLNVDDALSYQTWMPYNTNEIYKRICSGGTWQVWQLIATPKSSWAGMVSINTIFAKIGVASCTNYIDFEKIFSTAGTQPTLSKTLWAVSEISTDSANPTTIGTAGALNVQVYRDTANAVYIKYSNVGNSYPAFIRVSFC